MEQSKKTIFIAEDDTDLLLQMKMYLEAAGYTVITASCEKEATEIIENKPFDCAILDLMMDNMDSGFILSYKIKKRNKNIPVIIVTAVSKETGFEFDTDTRENRNWIKADKIINKDIRMEQLTREINMLVKR